MTKTVTTPVPPAPSRAVDKDGDPIIPAAATPRDVGSPNFVAQTNVVGPGDDRRTYLQTIEPQRISRLEWLASLDPRTLSLVELVELYVTEMAGNPHTERQYNLRVQLEHALWPEKFENEPPPIGRPQAAPVRVEHAVADAPSGFVSTGSLPVGAATKVTVKPKKK